VLVGASRDDRVRIVAVRRNASAVHRIAARPPVVERGLW